MMGGSVRWVAIVLTAFLAAIAGVAVGRWMIPPEQSPAVELHHVIHEQLALDTRQKAVFETIEVRFAVRRKVLEAEMRADNARLAAAIEAEHGYGPRVAAAVNASHLAMGTLQKETLAHLFAMRQTLRPDQSAKFDRAVARALAPEMQ